jgi:hypothetical protein
VLDAATSRRVDRRGTAVDADDSAVLTQTGTRAGTHASARSESTRPRRTPVGSRHPRKSHRGKRRSAASTMMATAADHE